MGPSRAGCTGNGDATVRETMGYSLVGADAEKAGESSLPLPPLCDASARAAKMRRPKALLRVALPPCSSARRACPRARAAN